MISSDSIATFSALVSVFLFHPALADETMDKLRQCRVSTVDAVRLACYDRVSDPAKAAIDEQSAATSAKGSNWTVQSQVSQMTDDTNQFVGVESSQPVACRAFNGPTAPLTIVARCMENTTAFYIQGDCQFASGFDGYGEVTWRTDDDKPVTRSFEVSTDSMALGLWSGKRAIPAIQSLFGKERLVLRVTPFGMSPVEATFDIAGLEDAIGPLRTECGW